MIDWHSHILPGMDDGSRSAAESSKLLMALKEIGVQRLALTPHFYTYEQPMEAFLKKREERFEAFSQLPEASEFQLTLGAEVYLTRELFNYEDLSPLCLAGTDCMLVELEYGATHFYDSFFERLDRLEGEYHITPVLAHIDRYDFLVKDPALLRKLKKMGCLFQVNFPSFGPFFQGRRLMGLAKKGLVDFFGSDSHRTPPSPQDWEKWEKKVEKSVPGLLRAAERRAAELFF